MVSLKSLVSGMVLTSSALAFFVILPTILRVADVPGLSPLAAAGEEDNNGLPVAAVINPIAGTDIDTGLDNSITDALVITKVPVNEPLDDAIETCPGLRVERSLPGCEGAHAVGRQIFENLVHIGNTFDTIMQRQKSAGPKYSSGQAWNLREKVIKNQ